MTIDKLEREYAELQTLDHLRWEDNRKGLISEKLSLKICKDIRSRQDEVVAEVGRLEPKRILDTVIYWFHGERDTYTVDEELCEALKQRGVRFESDPESSQGYIYTNSVNVAVVGEELKKLGVKEISSDNKCTCSVDWSGFPYLGKREEKIRRYWKPDTRAAEDKVYAAVLEAICDSSSFVGDVEERIELAEKITKAVKEAR